MNKLTKILMCTAIVAVVAVAVSTLNLDCSELLETLCIMEPEKVLY